MSKLQAASIRDTSETTSVPRSIVVTFGRKPEFVYRELVLGKLTVYLGYDGSAADFFVSGPDRSGFGGHTFILRMDDGSTREVVGPWSSNAAYINELFNLEDPLVQVVDVTTHSSGVVCHVPKSHLEGLGLQLVWHSYNDFRGYWY